MPREFARHLRVGSELKRILNDLLQSEVKDPRLKDVRVSDIELSGDLGVARVYYSTLAPDADSGPIDAALAKAAGFLRARVGHEIKLRRVPELRFEHDRSARQGMTISQLIDRTSRRDTDGEPAEEQDDGSP
jgi:ribosome-binding factor A